MGPQVDLMTINELTDSKHIKYNDLSYRKAHILVSLFWKQIGQITAEEDNRDLFIVGGL